jgi:hypothetical protein
MLGLLVTRNSKCNFSLFHVQLLAMWDADICSDYAGPTLQTKIPCYFYCWVWTKGKYK